MTKVKYFLWARLIKLFLQLAFLGAVLAIFVNLIVGIMNQRPSIKLGDGTLTIGNRYPTVKAGLHLNIPDTVHYYEDGMRLSKMGDVNNPFIHRRLTEKLVNTLITKDSTIKLSSAVRLIDSEVETTVTSSNRFYNLFWLISQQFSFVYYALILLILIKLTNRYMDGEIFEDKSFKLVSFLGFLLIFAELINLVVGVINMNLIGNPSLLTFSVIEQRNYNWMTVHLNFLKTISFQDIGIGILVILLSQVLKEAVQVKKENDLTV